MSERTWQPRYYGSGTTIVTSDEPGKPHYYLYGPFDPDEGKCQRNRHVMCEQLADYLNGGDRPKWLDDMERISEAVARDLDGSSITATGPMVDRNPPHLDWWQDDSDEAKDARARLMDDLFFANQLD